MHTLGTSDIYYREDYLVKMALYYPFTSRKCHWISE